MSRRDGIQRWVRTSDHSRGRSENAPASTKLRRSRTDLQLTSSNLSQILAGSCVLGGWAVIGRCLRPRLKTSLTSDMSWDPTVLRKYSTTSHFRLLNQVRSELKSSPLTRNQDGELSVSMGRRGPSYRVPVEIRHGGSSGGGGGSGRSQRSGLSDPSLPLTLPNQEGMAGDSTSFRDRLKAVDMR